VKAIPTHRISISELPKDTLPVPHPEQHMEGSRKSWTTGHIIDFNQQNKTFISYGKYSSLPE
jgi:hypothetical protein